MLMNKAIEKFLLNQKQINRKRFDLNTLEAYIINYYKSNGTYLEKGGYNEFYHQMIKLKEGGAIREIKTSDYNGFNPPLKSRWEIIVKESKANWEPSKMLKLADHINFKYYLNNPSYQTKREWEYIQNIHRFLSCKERREWVSVEERSLELFYDEKFITGRKKDKKGAYGILRRLQLSFEDLKMKKYGEMFIYWNKGVEHIKKVIILENHSTFFSYKRVMENSGEIFGFKADALIYGAGKKIENSLAFIEEIGGLADTQVLYFGDIDTEGLGIYCRLKGRYPHMNIKLQHQAYSHLIDISSRNYPLGGQKKNPLYLEHFLDEMTPYLSGDHIKKVINIWDKDLRIPQELISYEYLAGGIK